MKKTSEKEIFIKYLKIRSEYFDKGNDFDVVRSEVLKIQAMMLLMLKH
ncbi:MAG: hypothetical protein L6V95_02920 [Candidatus Melainabacteria bacterium]|nr:MAG: hypothetical protein L6V95_02920 [Candidatus Melainabacteria bacterium]